MKKDFYNAVFIVALLLVSNQIASAQVPNQNGVNNNTPSQSDINSQNQNDNFDLGSYNTSDLGTILVSANKMTLYTFLNDKPGISNCIDQCASIWIPYSVNNGEQINAQNDIGGNIGTITRSDGSVQITYDGMPLYLYAKDNNPGDVNGHEEAGLWSVVRL